VPPLACAMAHRARVAGTFARVAPCGHVWPATGTHLSIDSHCCARCWTKISKGRVTRSQPASGLGGAEGDLNSRAARLFAVVGAG
jgi:hypothetical protein